MVLPMRRATTAAATPTMRWLLTDGEIGNEQQPFDTISVMRGCSRVFMVGIGSAPNSFPMTRTASSALSPRRSAEQVESACAP